MAQSVLLGPEPATLFHTLDLLVGEGYVHEVQSCVGLCRESAGLPGPAATDPSPFHHYLAHQQAGPSRTRLAHAARAGNVARIADLAWAGADLDLPAAHTGATPLMASCAARCEGAALALIALGADAVLPVDKGFRSALHYAARYGMLEVIRRIAAAGGDVDAEDGFGAGFGGATPLSTACNANRDDAAALLLIELGAGGGVAALGLGGADTLGFLALQPALAHSPAATEWVTAAFFHLGHSDATPTMNYEVRGALLSAGAPDALVALARLPTVTNSGENSRRVANTLCRLSYTSDGAIACVAAGAPAALVALSRSPAVRGSAGAIREVACALCNMPDDGAGTTAACVAAGAPAALVALARLPIVINNSEAAESVCSALANIAGADGGRAAAIAVGAPAAMVELLTASPTIRKSPAAIERAVRVISNVAHTEEGRAACISSGAIAVLVALSRLPRVLATEPTLTQVVRALGNIATHHPGKTACVAAKVPARLVALAGHPTVLLGSEAAGDVVRGIANIASDPVGRATCVAKGAEAALLHLAQQPAAASNHQVAHWMPIAITRLGW